MVLLVQFKVQFKVQQKAQRAGRSVTLQMCASIGQKTEWCRGPSTPTSSGSMGI